VREALACRTPVVSVDVGDVARLVEGLPGCRICPREPGALAAGIVAALEAGRPEELRARAEQFSPVRVAEQIVGAYERVLAARRAP
jgi:glycosyltransferase involved in cell wall biosynthesis